MPGLKLAIFDVAGTVIDDHGEVVSSLVDALAAHGIGVGSEELAEFKGAAKREVIRFFGWRKLKEPPDEAAVEAVYAGFVRLVTTAMRSNWRRLRAPKRSSSRCVSAEFNWR
jgi:beta-phosphoglucomutase-like phosphatase (HAD superfamily)